MEKKPVNVQLIGKENGYYLIKFPNLKVPVKVNHNLLTKMRHSNDYMFLEPKNTGVEANSA